MVVDALRLLALAGSIGGALIGTLYAAAGAEQLEAASDAELAFTALDSSGLDSSGLDSSGLDPLAPPPVAPIEVTHAPLPGPLLVPDAPPEALAALDV